MTPEESIMTTTRDTGDPLPPYAFVPGGPWPHPRDLGQHKALPIVANAWGASPEYLRGIALFNAGYYWEAHEAWESLWHAHGRTGSTADVIKGLIKLAAAGVKVRQRQRHGVVTHACRAAALFRAARDRRGNDQLGLDLADWIETAEAVAAAPPDDPAPPGTAVSRVFAFQITPHATGAAGEGTREASQRRQAAAPATASTASTTALTAPCEPPSTNP
jgi:hypothetical protein